MTARTTVMIPSGLGGFMISLLVEDVVRGRVEPDDLAGLIRRGSSLTKSEKPL